MEAVDRTLQDDVLERCELFDGIVVHLGLQVDSPRGGEISRDDIVTLLTTQNESVEDELDIMHIGF